MPAAKFRELFDGNVLVFDLLAEYLADDRGDFRVRELEWTEKGISLSDMRSRVLQYGDDKACLVLRRDRGVTACTTKRNGHAPLPDHRREAEQPFREERRPEMHCRHARPIEYSLA
jgi:hypothetical protein